MDKVNYLVASVFFISLPLAGLYFHWLVVRTFVGQKISKVWLFALSLFFSSALAIYYGDLFALRLSIANIVNQAWKFPVGVVFAELIAILIIPGALVTLVELAFIKLVSPVKVVTAGQKRPRAFAFLFLANFLISISIGWYWLVRFAREIVTIPQ